MRGDLITLDAVVLAVGLALASAAGAAGALLGVWALLTVALVLTLTLAVFRWRRPKWAERQLMITPNLVLVATPTVVATSAVSTSIGAYLITALAGISFWLKRPALVLPTWAALALPAIALAIILRVNYPGTTMTVAVFIISSIAVIRAVALSESRPSAIESLVDGVGLFLVVSLGLWLGGFQGTASRTMGLDNALTGGQRVTFPLSSSLAATPAMAAIYVASVIPLLLTTRRHRSARIIALVCAGAIFFLSDSRISLGAGLALAACVLFLPSSFRRAAPFIVAMSPLVPFAYGTVQEGFGSVVRAASSWAPWIVRAGEEASSLNNRDFIWSETINFYVTKVDWVEQAIGFGSFGHAQSNVSTQYYGKFGGLGRDDRLMTPHNSVLQLLFDGGLLTVLAISLIVIVMAVKLSREITAVGLSALTMVTALSIVGITEVALSPAHAQPPWWVLLALSTIVFSQQKQVTGKSKSDVSDTPTATSVP